MHDLQMSLYVWGHSFFVLKFLSSSRCVIESPPKPLAPTSTSPIFPALVEWDRILSPFYGLPSTHHSVILTVPVVNHSSTTACSVVLQISLPLPLSAPTLMSLGAGFSLLFDYRLLLSEKVDP